MSKGYGANHYKNISIKTASPTDLLIMFYEGAIKNVKIAADCIQKKDLEGKGKAIGKAHDIINELSNTLDHKVGGNIARDLEGLYNFMTEQLVMANINNSVDNLSTVEKILRTLLEGWRGAIQKVKAGEGTAAE